MNVKEIKAPLITIDANIPLAIAFPHSTRMSAENIRGAERIMHALDEGRIAVIVPSIFFGEIRWVYLREGREGFEIIYHRLRTALKERFYIVGITPELAIRAAEYRGKYYSPRRAFSYNDGLYLAVAVSAGAKCLVSSDPHLMEVEEIKTIEPRDFVERVGLGKEA